MSPTERSRRDRYEAPATEPELEGLCAICGRGLWSDGLPPARDGDAWICGDCDAARNVDMLRVS